MRPLLFLAPTGREGHGSFCACNLWGEHPEAVKTFLEEYAASTAYVNEHPAEAAALVEQYIGVKAAIAEKAIPACNIVCVTGEEMKQAAGGYLKVLFDLNPKAVGGALPADDFYYMP